MKGIKLERREAGRCIDCGAPAAPRAETRPVAERKARETGKHVNLFLYFGFCVPCTDKRNATVERNRERKRTRTRSSRASTTALRERRIAAGECAECGGRAASPGRKSCAECRARISAANARRKAGRDTAGNCVACGLQRENPKFKHCLDCRAAAAARMAKARD